MTTRILHQKEMSNWVQRPATAGQKAAAFAGGVQGGYQAANVAMGVAPAVRAGARGQAGAQGIRQGLAGAAQQRNPGDLPGPRTAAFYANRYGLGRRVAGSASGRGARPCFS